MSHLLFKVGSKTIPEGEEMKHPKTCYGCKAFWQSQWKYNCDLGFELNIEKKGQFKGMDITHISPKSGTCPKPLTLKELMAAPHAQRGM